MASNPAFDTALTPLAGKLAPRIAANRPISFHDYIEVCLYDPEYGYYRNKDPLGRGGDFITAPEISQVFGEIVGLWAGEAWRLMGEPGCLRLIELGPGRGTLMADALRVLRVLPAFMKAVTVHLVETSEALRRVQAGTLAHIDCPIDWHGCIEEIPSGPTVLIANEFFDCLPVRQFQYDESSGLWRERMVAFEQGSFKFVLDAKGMGDPLTPRGEGVSGVPSPQGEKTRMRGDLLNIEDGTIVEARPATGEILQTFAERAAITPFVAIVIDYGYSKPSLGDTVQAVKNHRFVGAFDALGETDLTAHVDFSALATEAIDLNLAVHGPMPMGQWLLRLGLETRAQQLLSNASAKDAEALMSGISRLTDPAQMGVHFKVIALSSGGLAALPPFS